MDAGEKTAVDGLERVEAHGERTLRQFSRRAGGTVDDALSHGGKQFVGHGAHLAGNPSS